MRKPTVDRTGEQRRGAVRRRIALVAATVVVSAMTITGCSEGEATGRSGSGHGVSGRSTSVPAKTTTTESTPEAALIDAVCGGAAKIADVGTVDTPEVTEASGLVASWDNTGNGAAGPWWIHNDSRATPRIYAIDGTGKLLATVELIGAENRDWEDIAVGPPAIEGGRPQIYVGDIGNNKAMLKDPTARKSVRIYRLDEPVVPAAPPAVGAAAPVVQVPVVTFSLRYPDKAYDAEALLVDPVKGDLVVITKDWSRSGKSQMFRMPKAATIAEGTSIDMLPAGEIPLEPNTLVTGADVTRDGSLVGLRSYGSVALYRRPKGKPITDAFATTPCDGPVPTEVQGESIAFAPDAGSYLTVSEGDSPMLHRTSP